MSLLAALPIAASGMAAEAERLSAVASNLANANSATNSTGQPYRAREVVFAAAPLGGDTRRDGFGTTGRMPLDGGPATLGMAGVRVAAIVQSADPLRKVYDPGSNLADVSGFVTLPNVDAVEEMVNMISAQQGYQADLEAFNVAKTLAQRTLTI
jgi:flagellar basal-body rod protein FlgC